MSGPETQPEAAYSDQEPVQRRVQRVLDGRKIFFDGEGFFMHAEDWTRQAARILAQEAGLADLRDDHWKVIDYLRDYFIYNGRTALNVELKNGTGMSLLALEALFPGGIKQGVPGV
ncbi:MAG: TusE/DsrC/DsvC family sulfur relay protein [Desulfobacteraceae bacterium]|jgi:tRNA 2-thiouridine synthesizing protein E